MMDGMPGMRHFVDIGPLEDIPRLGARTVSTAMGDIAVFRTSDDNVYALRDRCPHKAGPLSQGIVHGSTVTCPLHGWVISLATGEAQGKIAAIAAAVATATGLPKKQVYARALEIGRDK